MQQPKNEEQTQTLPDQTQGQQQVDGPDKIIVNEQEQNIPVNLQDEDIDEPINGDNDSGSLKEKDDKKKGYDEGHRNDSERDDDEELIPDEEPEKDII